MLAHASSTHLSDIQMMPPKDTRQRKTNGRPPSCAPPVAHANSSTQQDTGVTPGWRLGKRRPLNKRRLRIARLAFTLSKGGPQASVQAKGNPILIRLRSEVSLFNTRSIDLDETRSPGDHIRRQRRCLPMQAPHISLTSKWCPPKTHGNAKRTEDPQAVLPPWPMPTVQHSKTPVSTLLCTSSKAAEQKVALSLKLARRVKGS